MLKKKIMFYTFAYILIITKETMSEGITHIAIVDDNIHLILNAPFISDAFKAALSANQGLARLGSITRYGDRYNPQLLTELREIYKEGKAGEKERNRLCWVLGWMSHRAADRTVKHIFRKLDEDCPISPTDCSVYHDAVSFKAVYGSGSGPFPKEVISQGGFSKAEIAVQALFQRMMVSMHTFKPDEEDIANWIDRAEELRQKAYVNLERYRKAAMEPDEDMMKRFIIDPNFYNPKDPIITVARCIANGEDVKIKWDKLLDEKQATSIYAQALRRAFRYVKAANEYFNYEINMDELVERMDIGKPELETENLV